MNLIEGIQQELERAKKLLKCYEGLGPCGRFGFEIIKGTIERAEKSISESDTVQMAKSLGELRRLD